MALPLGFEGGLSDIISALKAGQFKAPTVVGGNLVASDAASGVFSWHNTTGHDCVVEALINVTTAATGACTLDTGQAATNILSDNLMDGSDVHTAAAMFCSANDGQTNAKAKRICKNGEYVTCSMASGATAGMVGVYMLTLQYLN